MEQKMFINTDMVMKATKDEDRIVEFIASKEVVDRGGDVVKIKGMDLRDYKKNPVIMWSHRHDDPPIGKAVSMTKSGDELKMKVQFATPEEYGFADTIYKLVKGGYIKATSIGIIPDYESMEYPESKNKKAARRIINKSSLFELSIVPIPMNQDALATGKSLSKAIEDGVIDDLELTEYNLMSKDTETTTEPETDIKDADTVIVELKSRIAELELQIKEQEMDAELEDDIYSDLYDDFVGEKKVDKDVIDELYDEFMSKAEDDNDILDEYL
jgi:HK97 family phage prohead protease